MKKILSLVLILAMALALGACGSGSGSMGDGSTTAAEPEVLLKAGYAQVDITPTDPVPINEGGDENGMSTGFIDYLYANCIYLVDSNGTELYLVAFDLCNMYAPLPEYRLELAQKLGVSDQQLMFSASHTHSSVNIKATEESVIVKYNDALKKDLEKVALKAKEDVKPVTGMYHTSTETENLNFVRRYLMNDGTYAGDNFGSSASGYAAHEAEPDRQLQLLKFTREGGKDIILTNFQTHPHRTAYDTKNNTSLSSDIVGVYRQELEQQLDCLALYYTGASGDVNPTSKITEENIYKNHREHGKAMAQYAVEAAANFTPVEMGPIRLAKTVYTGTVNHTEDHKAADATVVADRYNSGMGKSASLEGYEDLFEHPLHAVSLVSRVAMPETLEINLYSFSIGGFSACYAPFELFTGLGVSIKEGSPFDATFVVCCSNDLFSYIPTQLAVEHGGYGVYNSRFVPGSGEELADLYVQLLESLHSSD